MRPLYIFIVSLALCQMASAQTKQSSKDRYSSHNDNASWFVKLNAYGLLDPGAPTLQLGAEYRFYKRVGIELTAGIPVNTWGGSLRTDSTYYRYYKLKAGLRFYPGRRPRFYLGPEFFFTHRARNKYDGVVMGKDGVGYEYRYAELEKTILGVVIKTGIVMPVSNRLNLETAFGFGPRYVYLDLHASNLDRTNFVRSFFRFNTDRIGSSMGVHVMSEFKLSYIIK